MVDNKELHLEKFKLRLESNDVKKSLAPKFNVFDVLKIKSNEVLNSNILAWLLNPKETHGLGSLFLDNFFCKFINEKQNIEFSSVDDIQVYTEFNYIDIMVISQSNKFILVIENKIYTDEHDNQLSKYYDYIESLGFENYEIYCFFLTIDKHKPQKEEDSINWKAISHSEILDIIESIIEQKKDMENNVRYFLCKYKKTLGELTMQDNENKQLCDELYVQYSKEINYILETATKPADYLKEELEKNIIFKQVSVENFRYYDMLRFVTSDMLEVWRKYDSDNLNSSNTTNNFMVEIVCTPYPTKIRLTLKIDCMDYSEKEQVKSLLSKVALKQNDYEIVIIQNSIKGLPKDSIKEYIHSLNLYVKKIEEWIFNKDGCKGKIDTLMNTDTL